MFESRKRHHFSAIGLLVATAAQPALATAPQSADLPEAIVVTGRALDAPEGQRAYAGDELTREDARSLASGRIEDLLARAPGVQQFRRSDSRSANPSAQGITLRGLGGNASSRTLVLLDGVPLVDPFFGYVPLSALPPERFDSVRVLRGGGAGAFAAGAVAGTIDLASAGPDALGLFSAAALVNDRGESELSASLAPRLGSGFAVLSGRWDRGQGFWTTSEAQRVPASVRARFDSWSTALRAVAPLGPELELQARASLFDDNRTLRFAGADSGASGQDASLRLVGRGAWQFEALGYVQARDFSNVVISATSFRKTLDQRRTPATGLGAKFELRPPLGEAHALRLGIDWRRQSGEMQEEAYSAVTGLVTARRKAGGVNSDLGLYAEHDWRSGPLLLTLAARVDRWEVAQGFFREANGAGTVTSNLTFAARSGWQESLRGGIRVQAAPGLALRAAAYSGMRQPTLNELYRPFTVFPVTTRANAALANERLEGFEGGLDWSPLDDVTLRLTAFDNRVKGAIANVTIGPNLRERRNVDAVRSRGLEAALAVTAGQVSLDTALSWLSARVQASGASAALNGKRPAQVPRLSAIATLAWQPAERALVALSLKHTGAQWEDDLQTDRLAAATTLDAVAEVPLGQRLALVLRAENLTDAQVITRNQAGSIDLGAPRTLWAGFRISM
ncbi:TonB-dependent receptor [Novosphingobium sp.]|uniref:TonB-dependent receptor plug domain-containing protein n=1 Tax=Novosphingobium sp. TaxID=1874826 RepID=UPI0022C5D67C|nr:TonB-dependent receptor [Novosphingobium sp.]MCZ8018185.1 TonB-dependent receptor [Novosphingobium sp.]MCZ8033179.1 TonB-dependent receptor [Novosphingobium sp.]MCZ8051634.1 TonB-dependent receptor [Novosphingobium sp.]MCZ8060176.1 TonB-dependent receptor [Novosphingobium sp.]MCZ8231818.1 TonB-dependent receptor [Novosphingobium sp.]